MTLSYGTLIIAKGSVYMLVWLFTYKIRFNTLNKSPEESEVTTIYILSISVKFLCNKLLKMSILVPFAIY